MGRRSANLDAFRPDRHAVAATTPNRRQALALVVVLLLVAAAIAVASYLVKPSKAKSFQLFYGSLFLNDERAPVAIDLTNGKPTVRLVDANQQVSATNPTDLTVVPLTGGTLLLNRSSGEFNLVDETGFVIKNQNGGVPLPTASGARETFAVPAADSAYLVQTGTTGTSVYLVGKPTVQAAAAGAPVRPRASATMTQPAQTTSGGAVSAGGDLWLLAGSGSARVVRQLHVPTGTDAGATLASTDHGNVAAIAALTAAPQNADGTGTEVVGVATPTAVETFDADGTAHSTPLTGLSGVDQILPANSGTGSLAFLYHSAAGWSVVSIGTDGNGLDGPHAIGGIPGSIQLTAPAESNGRLYTLDAGSTGRLFSVGLDGSSTGVGDVTAYPVVTANGRALEAATFTDAYTVARGDRVIFDSPHHVRALAVFTDGSRDPLVIDKSAAADLNSAGTALALDTTDKTSQQQQQEETKPQPQPQQQVNNAIACKTTKQVPHVPNITRATPGSRSVELHWTYPLLDPQDCVPSTYQVKVKLLSANAPSAPGSVTVQGQDAVTLAQLFPSTRYELTVTAFLNGTGTPSSPVQITTGPEGPAAPTNVRTEFSNGKWIVSWNSCGGVASGCVPTTNWNVVPRFCDNLGLSSPPSSQSVPGDPTSHSFSTSLTADAGLLGRKVSFTVEGVGLQGTIGDPRSDGSCTQSYGPPLASQVNLHASTPPTAGGNGLTSTTATAAFNGSATVAVGGVGGTIRFQLLNRGAVYKQSDPLSPTPEHQSFKFDDAITAGQAYQVRLQITTPHNQTAFVGPVDVEPAAANWPDFSISPSFTDTNGVSGTLRVHFSGPSSAQSAGETFELANSNLTCHSTSMSLDNKATNFDPSSYVLTVTNINRTQYYGDCSVHIQFREHDPDSTPYYGGTLSPGVTRLLNIDKPTLGGSPSDGWTATWDHDRQQGGTGIIRVAYNGNNGFVLAAPKYSVKALDPNNAVCGSATLPGGGGQPRGPVSVSRQCMNESGASTGTWLVKITYTVAIFPQTFTVQVTGAFPT